MRAALTQPTAAAQLSGPTFKQTLCSIAVGVVAALVVTISISLAVELLPPLSRPRSPLFSGLRFGVSFYCIIAIILIVPSAVITMPRALRKYWRTKAPLRRFSIEGAKVALIYPVFFGLHILLGLKRGNLTPLQTQRELLQAGLAITLGAIIGLFAGIAVGAYVRYARLNMQPKRLAP